MPYKLKSQGGKFCVVNAETGKTVNCHADKPKAMRQLRAISTNEKASLDTASEYRFVCHDEACERRFIDFDAMVEHAEAVHTFEDISRLVGEAVREKYYQRGDYRAVPAVPSVYAWVNDLANDWVVFQVEKDGDSTLYKASYAITDGAVTLGEAVEVRRRTVYEPVKKQED